MAVIAVVISTDHEDHEDAVRSVSAHLGRVGYDVLNYKIHKTIHSLTAHAVIEACEPEVNPRGRASNRA